MKGSKTVSKNARTDRKKADKLKFNGQEVDPIVMFAHFGGNKGKFQAAVYSGTKKLVTSPTGQILTWDEVAGQAD